ncbi:hypothetical protein [Phycisphaera mikurensis]|uniref:hypothetical protein n=1 Tax=Phycisphaera mikurensis TaxID=547188 RepID=UPI00160C973B|nr:hypothetical protein [Phycisphaera mikurensis]
MAGLCDWLDVSKAFRSGSGGQQARPILGAVGWFRYLAKHCGRGRSHYQRQQAAMPKAWESAPRAWGKSGPWPLQDGQALTLGSRQFYRLRRLIRAQRVARARSVVPGPGWSWRERWAPLYGRQDLRDLPLTPKVIGAGASTSLRTRLRHLQGARRMLACPQRRLSAVRGISEWIPEAGQDDLLRAIGASRGDLRELAAEV